MHCLSREAKAPLHGMTPKLLDVSPALGRRERMDREILLLRLAQAEQSVAESKAFVARQQRLIVESERDGQDTAETIRLLDKLLRSGGCASKSAICFSDEISEPS